MLDHSDGIFERRSGDRLTAAKRTRQYGAAVVLAR